MLKRFPARDELLSVLSFIAFLVYGRMLFVFAWKLPSWLNYLTLGEIFSILSYSLAIALFESLVYLLALALVCAILPAAWFRRGFVARGVWVMAVWLVSWTVYFSRMSALGMESGFAVLDYLYPWLAVTLALMLIFGGLAPRVQLLTRSGLWLAEHTLIFLFLLVPASMVGLIVAILRNLS